jgi:hypothetical protein
MGFGGREFARRAAANPVFIQALSVASSGRVIPVPGGVLIRDQAGEILGAVRIVILGLLIAFSNTIFAYSLHAYQLYSTRIRARAVGFTYS